MESQPPQPAPENGQSRAPNVPYPEMTQYVENHLAGSILVTLFCCMPFGAVGIAYAAQVNTALALGRRDLAVALSKKASYWMWLSVILAVVVWGLYALFMIAVGAADAGQRGF